MFRVTLDKIGSAAKNAEIARDVYLSEEIVSREGYVLAVKIVSDKAVYNTLENTHGRMMRIKPGDLIAGVLGSRRALYGYSGDVPEGIKVGDIVHVLNLGGVLGHCTSYAPDVGEPFEAEVMGAVLHFPVLGERIGEPVHIGLGAIPHTTTVPASAPIIAIVGTSMSSGKTVAACQIVHGLTKRGLRVAAAKVTGVALQRDVLDMQDRGAVAVLSFNDTGLTTTTPENAAKAATSIIAELNRTPIDAIVLELGDGLLGEYGVQSVLRAKEVAKWIRSTVLCASDPVGALGGVRILDEQYGLKVSAIAGRVTDNQVGRLYISSELDISAASALTAPETLVAIVYKEVFGDA